MINKGIQHRRGASNNTKQEQKSKEAMDKRGTFGHDEEAKKVKGKR